MRRPVLLACVVVLCAGFAPARAETTVPGTVIAPVPAGPSLARQMYLFSDKLDGVAGDVIGLTPSAEPRSFDLNVTSGATGDEDLDVYFYTSLDGTGAPCARDADATADGGEEGTMCAGAAWAIVTLFSGADATFTLRY